MKKTKRERFVELAPRRVSAAMNAIRRVARFGNRRSYEMHEDEARAITLALEAELVRLHEAFKPQPGGKPKGATFELPQPDPQPADVSV